MVFGCDQKVLHPGILGIGYPLVRIEFVRIKYVSHLLILRPRNML